MDNRTQQEVERDFALHTAAQTEDTFKLFSMIKPDIRRDEDVWEVFYGSNLMDGVVGYGDTPYLAVLDWNKSWNKKAQEVPEWKPNKELNDLITKNLKKSGMI